jgi:hypothetical protein
MTHMEPDGSGVAVPETLLAEAFGIAEDQVRHAMHHSTLTSICAINVGAETGRWRLTPRPANRARRFTLDEAHTILSTPRFLARARLSNAQD